MTDLDFHVAPNEEEDGFDIWLIGACGEKLWILGQSKTKKAAWEDALKALDHLNRNAFKLYRECVRRDLHGQP